MEKSHLSWSVISLWHEKTKVLAMFPKLHGLSRCKSWFPKLHDKYMTIYTTNTSKTFCIKIENAQYLRDILATAPIGLHHTYNVILTCGNSSPSAHPPFDKALGQPPENWFWPSRTVANLMPFYLKVMLGTETSGDSSEQALDVVKACEGDARCHWPFHKVHGQTLVKTPHQPLLSAIFSVAVDVWEILCPTKHRTKDKPGQSFNSLFYSSSKSLLEIWKPKLRILLYGSEAIVQL